MCRQLLAYLPFTDRSERKPVLACREGIRRLEHRLVFGRSTGWYPVNAKGNRQNHNRSAAYPQRIPDEFSAQKLPDVYLEGRHPFGCGSVDFFLHSHGRLMPDVLRPKNYSWQANIGCRRCLRGEVLKYGTDFFDFGFVDHIDGFFFPEAGDRPRGLFLVPSAVFSLTSAVDVKR